MVLRALWSLHALQFCFGSTACTASALQQHSALSPFESPCIAAPLRQCSMHHFDTAAAWRSESFGVSMHCGATSASPRAPLWHCSNMVLRALWNLHVPWRRFSSTACATLALQQHGAPSPLESPYAAALLRQCSMHHFSTAATWCSEPFGGSICCGAASAVQHAPLQHCSNMVP